MDGQQAKCADVQANLRDYVLERRTDLDGHFAACPACREALEAERAALARLDALPPIEPPAGLADATLRRIAEEDRKVQARNRRPIIRLAYSAVWIGLAGVVAALLLPALQPAREAALRSSMANTLKQWDLVMKMYANESRGGMYPPKAPGVDVFDLRVLYPEFVSDPSILVNPDLPDAADLLEQARIALAQDPPDWDRAHRIAARSFVYTGFMLRDASDIEMFEEARVRADDKDIAAAGRTVYRLREGIERFLITDINNPAASSRAASDIPLIVESPASASRRRGGKPLVLYLDGHVEYAGTHGKFPLIEPGQGAPPPRREEK